LGVGRERITVCCENGESYINISNAGIAFSPEEREEAGWIKISAVTQANIILDLLDFAKTALQKLPLDALEPLAWF
jgi:hypothetical protein